MDSTLPDGWTRTTLGEICERVDSIDPRETPDVEFTYFDISGIDNERNRVSETKRIPGRTAPSRARQRVQKDDILFSTVRTYLRNVARIEAEYPNPVASTGFVVIRPAEGISSQFLFFQVLSDQFLEPLSATQSGVSYPAVRERDVFAQPILVPPLEEQERIARKLDIAMSALQRGQAAALRAQKRLRDYRAAVLRSATSGELSENWREAHA